MCKTEDKNGQQVEPSAKGGPQNGETPPKPPKRSTSSLSDASSSGSIHTPDVRNKKVSLFYLAYFPFHLIFSCLFWVGVKKVRWNIPKYSGMMMGGRVGVCLGTCQEGLGFEFVRPEGFLLVTVNKSERCLLYSRFVIWNFLYNIPCFRFPPHAPAARLVVLRPAALIHCPWISRSQAL